MKARELKIGNYVYTGTDEDDNPVPCKITALDKFNVYWDGNKTSVNFIEPIPITPEWLEKMGFSYLKVEGITRIGDDFQGYADEGDTHNWTLKVKANERTEGFAFEIVKWGDGPYTFVNQWLRIRVKYLHDIQNIFHALTGQELNINIG